jgi:hypothetical protein
MLLRGYREIERRRGRMLGERLEREIEMNDACEMKPGEAWQQGEKAHAQSLPPPPILTRYGHTLTPIGLHVLMFGGWDGTRASADVITLAFPSPPEMQENDAQGGGMAFDDGPQFDYDDMGVQGQGQGQGQDMYDDGGAGGGGGY